MGLIPARAGKTHPRDAVGGLGWAHPRTGGENTTGSHSAGELPGSSPHGRGKLTVPHSACGVRGLIPARAGKTRGDVVCESVTQAHPRTGGENFDVTELLVRNSGSSPHGRGKRPAARRRTAPTGLIPARAGKTADVGFPRRALRAHPRTGGENAHNRGIPQADTGSSPHGRGKLGGNRP